MSVDFEFIEAAHANIHKRLVNWGRWCRGRPQSQVAPMFRLYRSDEHWEGQEPSIPVDKVDALKIAKGVSMLPQPHMRSLNWFYVSPCPPKRAAIALETNLPGLARFVTDGRKLLDQYMAQPPDFHANWNWRLGAVHYATNVVGAEDD